MANAHFWITLVDGSILDGTLQPSIAHRDGRQEPLSFYDAIYIKRHDFSDGLEYLPLMIGLHYHFEVVIHEYFVRQSLSRATRATDIPGKNVCSTIARFSCTVRRAILRRPGSPTI
jgi:hypothetical protein